MSEQLKPKGAAPISAPHRMTTTPLSPEREAEIRAENKRGRGSWIQRQIIAELLAELDRLRTAPPRAVDVERWAAVLEKHFLSRDEYPVSRCRCGEQFACSNTPRLWARHTADELAKGRE